jgi:DNA-binding transcriptional regulator YiaG
MKTIREEDLSALLKKLRGNLSMEEFGRPFGASKQLVFHWESGRSRPRPEVLQKMGVKIIYSAQVE